MKGGQKLNYKQYKNKTMKKLFTYALGLVMLMPLFHACSDEPGNGGYTGTNKVYLSVKNEAVITENDTTPLAVTVELTTACEENIQLTFEILDDEQGVLRLEGNPVAIAAGEKQATFEVVSNNQNLLTEEVRFRIAMSTFPQDLQLDQALEVVVRPNPAMPQLTEDQKALIEGYKTKFGIDLNEWLGVVNCKTTVHSPADGYLQPFVEAFTREIKGYSIITLSEEATADVPVLKMTYNPLGLTEYLYWVLRQETVEDAEYFANPDEEYNPSNLRFMEILEWNKDSKETFSMTLDGISLEMSGQTANVNFTGTTINVYEEEIVTVPFVYEFSAYGREQELLAEGNAELQELVSCGITANPQNYLFYSTIGEDYWEMPENYIAPKATLDFEKGTLNFEFVFDHTNAGGYSRVYVEYSI